MSDEPDYRGSPCRSERVEQNTLEAYQRLVHMRNGQIGDLNTALITAQHQSNMAAQRILALEAELELARRILAMADDGEAIKDGKSVSEEEVTRDAIERVIDVLPKIGKGDRGRLREGLDRADQSEALRRAIGRG